MNAIATQSRFFDAERPREMSVCFDDARASRGIEMRTVDNTVSTERMNAVQEIGCLSTLESNWDGYGGLPISAEVRNNAAFAISSLSDGLPMPDIAPNSNGTISLDWESPHGKACLEIGKSRFSFFIKRPSGPPFLMDGNANETQSVGDAIAFSLFPPLPASSLPLMVVAFDRRKFAAHGCGW